MINSSVFCVNPLLIYSKYPVLSVFDAEVTIVPNPWVYSNVLELYVLESLLIISLGLTYTKVFFPSMLYASTFVFLNV